MYVYLTSDSMPWKKGCANGKKYPTSARWPVLSVLKQPKSHFFGTPHKKEFFF